MKSAAVVRLPKQEQQPPQPSATPSLVGLRERYRLHPTIAEAALLWSGLSFGLLDGCRYLSPCIPDIPGHPDVSARAEVLLEATTRGDLVCSKAWKAGSVYGELADPLEEAMERRTIARKDLMAWIAETFPDELPGKNGAPVEPVGERLLTQKEVLVKLGCSRSDLYRRMAAGTFPRPTQGGAKNRWLESVVDAYIHRTAVAANDGYRPSR